MEIGGSKSLPELQARVDDWIRQVGVRYFSELTNLAVLMEEVGELARIFARTYGEQSFKKSDESYNLGDEMADILFVLICLANQTGVDLEEAFLANLKKKTQRDARRHLENPKLSQEKDFRSASPDSDSGGELT
jgi:NTP pyrophosphatase (non-canonical NTP hydrolase)